MGKALDFYHRWLSIVAFSTFLLALVGYASNETVGMFYVSMTCVALLVTIFHYLFGSGSTFFNIVFANAITIYLCVFTFFVDSIFTGLHKPTLAAGFIMPMIAFAAGTALRRGEIRAIISAQTRYNEREFIRSFAWLFPIALVGVVAFTLHQHASLSEGIVKLMFLGEMATISLIVAFASKDFTLLLMDTGILFSDFFTQNARLIKPVFAFFTFYSLNIIVFAALYRITDIFSLTRNFQIHGVDRVITFVESLYFSLVTVSTLGFGDIIPLTNTVRFIVALQTVLGTLLFFFGVHAILSHKNKH